MQGAAPGAQIVSGRACTFTGGCTSTALAEGMIDLVTKYDVDVVNMSIGGLPSLNDGSDATALLYDELVEQTGTQIFVSAGNAGPGLNTVGSPSVAEQVVSVAASVSKGTWWANYGARVEAGQGIFNFSSRGPSENGGLKPTIAAPGAAVSTTPLWLPGVPVPEAGYPLPPGYSMFNGTSMASPQATGAAALLLSAAKATGKDAHSPALRTAHDQQREPHRRRPDHRPGHGTRRHCCRVEDLWRRARRRLGTTWPHPCARLCRTSSPRPTRAPASTTVACPMTAASGRARPRRTPSR